VTELDWILVVVVAFSAFGGYKRGLIRTAFALVGLVVGAVLGARIAPHFLPAGEHSRYTALVGLVGATIGVAVTQVAAGLLAGVIRNGLRLLPPLRTLDSLAGLAIGAVWGLSLCWVVGAVALQVPGQPKVRRAVRHSEVLQRLDGVASPHDILRVQKQLVRFESQVQARLGDG
jgi:uncharacterized membrane protein required for colicin V production